MCLIENVLWMMQESSPISISSTTATKIWIVIGMWDRSKPDYQSAIQVAEWVHLTWILKILSTIITEDNFNSKEKGAP